MIAVLNKNILKINGITYHFKITNRTILRIDKKYGRYPEIIKGMMEGEDFFTNALKILSCSCMEKEWDIDELIDSLTGQQLNFIIPSLVADVYFEYIGAGEAQEEGTEEEKK
ncbi:RNA polymerase subunit sigma [Clostridium phage CWou-2020a]|uniref:Phage protein n=1 Tax=Clostridium botulinum C/D str. DC5 TaxID=1443128 RepID=A0A0A0IJR0_CLOBO|nr:hypothetical protein [Clostridium botulinum]QPW59416.1 RNA polymerase subunit sigma [Clostridium phage CWou-2020a]KGN00824.1 hypothetical protein Z955_02375 [Clostridium botulinum C/D str. DC5]KOC54194.1 hypothetical protein ADU90_12710 [Clostridium botulinum]KOC56538.1 hypothetical protein ADU89_02720 [Clostridium botulinum]MCD3240921.1 RNA polymerase subunit sigma [Clostridium botulinum D/C]